MNKFTLTMELDTANLSRILQLLDKEGYNKFDVKQIQGKTNGKGLRRTPLTPEEIAQVLTFISKNKNWSNTRIAEKVGISSISVARIRAGERT
jgi:hypothetical protein